MFKICIFTLNLHTNHIKFSHLIHNLLNVHKETNKQKMLKSLLKDCWFKYLSFRCYSRDPVFRELRPERVLNFENSEQILEKYILW